MIADVKERARYFRDNLERMYERTSGCPPCGDIPTNRDGHQVSDNELEAYLKDFVDVTYKVNASGEYISCCITKEYGGPNTYIDTDTEKIEVYWGGEKGTCDMGPELVDKVDSIMEAHYNKVIERRCLR